MDHPGEKHGQNDGANEDLVFYVRIQYRRNTSWQGTIQWMDGKKTGIFRSVLEMGNMISEAKAEKSNDINATQERFKWKGKDIVS